VEYAIAIDSVLVLSIPGFCKVNTKIHVKAKWPRPWAANSTPPPPAKTKAARSSWNCRW